MPDHIDILVIGGGPAGIFAAVTAARHAAGRRDEKTRRIALLEHNHMLGRKLGKTGNGRCNITNRAIAIERYHGGDTRFLHNVLPRFTSDDLLAWFGERGVEFKEEDQGCIFPVTDQASTIVDVLKEEVERCGVEAVSGVRVEEASREKSGLFAVRCSGGKPFSARALVIAAGGPAYPQLGACEDGYSFAKVFGHTIVPPTPALVALEIANKSLFDLQGVKALVEVKAYQAGGSQGEADVALKSPCHSRPSAALRLNSSGNPASKASAKMPSPSSIRPVATATDELLFTHYGVSGPAVLHLSSFVTRGLPGTETILRINFFPGLARDAVEGKILSLWKNSPKRSLGNSLMGILPKKIPQVLFRSALGMDVETSSDKVSRQDRSSIVDILTGLDLKITATRGFKDAQVASGGVRTAEVEGKTMESRLVKGLYFAGEVLDINGDCGGFNLQFAFTSGYLAGLAASR